MSDKVVGVVEKISQRGKAFNINVDGTWYGFGFEEPDFSEGVTAEFEVVKRGRFMNVDNKTFKVVDEKSAPKKGSTGGKGSYGDVQRSINWQSARNAAIEVARIGVEAGAISLGSTKAKKLDALFAFIDNTTERYYYDTDTVATQGVEAVVGQRVENTDDELDDEELNDDE